jgi:hypothetical protein
MLAFFEYTVSPVCGSNSIRPQWWFSPRLFSATTFSKVTWLCNRGPWPIHEARLSASPIIKKYVFICLSAAKGFYFILSKRVSLSPTAVSDCPVFMFSISRLSEPSLWFCAKNNPF